MWVRLVCFSALVIASISAEATLITYTYQGSPWETIADPSPWKDAAQDFVSGYMVLDTNYLPGNSIENAAFLARLPPAPDPCPYAGCSETPIHYYSFFDGVLIWDFLDAPIAFRDFWIETDAYGNIASWDIILAEDHPDLVISSSSGDAVTRFCGPDGQLDCARTNVQGTWVQVDEPTSALLLGTGLFGLLIARRRRVTELRERAGPSSCA